MSSSAISICSNALAELGSNPIASFALSEGKHARTAGNLWPQVRDALLRAHPWPSIRKAVILAPETSLPGDEFDWSYSFLLPSDWLRTLQVGYRRTPIDHECAGNRILADTTVLPLRYCARVEDPSQWDSMLCDLAGAAMRARLAYAVTQSSTVATEAKSDYERLLSTSKAIAGQDNPPEDWGDSPFYEARF